MEFGERKRRRKSQSFKLVTDEDFGSSYGINSSCRDANGESRDAAAPQVWMGDGSMEIKKQITGMMRLLGDKTGRGYQRLGVEQNSSTKEPQESQLNCMHSPPVLPVVSEDQSWSSPGDPEPPPSSKSTSLPNGQACSQYSTRSRGLRTVSTTKDLIKPSETKDELRPAVPEIPCCMCNCKGTLQAILHELRAMRRLMQTQKGTFERREHTKSSCQPHVSLSSSPRRISQKRRPMYKVTPLSLCGTGRTALFSPGGSTLKTSPREDAKKKECEKLDSSLISCDVSEPPSRNDQIADSGTHGPLLNALGGHQALESDVRLAEDYDVFISKAQLDSILVNYTRSGSLLFRKLVCAFFDDATLANSLPNGKRKRGLNDNRKGLDQNIVGAIKVFTEKYCTEHRIEKLPGPRDWMLQMLRKTQMNHLQVLTSHESARNCLAFTHTHLQQGFFFNRFESDEQKLLNKTDFISCHYCLAADQFIFNISLALFICHPPSFLYISDQQFELHNKRSQSVQNNYLLSINHTFYCTYVPAGVYIRAQT
ncbi:BEN domain-containing protein 7 isoform X2 [Poecilia formosa]|uniref:BEN domain-containing protein 7 isoform X2 n=1 Tax=Poecilia formosa TaxID=48698 RepID=UPI0007B8E157|nr:PREDICTED: BEN domain-containing protein 7 isoform X2 [Poecilia formosa]